MVQAVLRGLQSEEVETTMMKRTTVLVVAVMFALVSLPAMADWGYQWGVKKDKYGKCHVIPLRPIGTPKGPAFEKVAAGPFATRDEAIQAAKETCDSLPTPEPAQWGVIKGKNGKCRVIPMKNGATPETVAGPFATRNEATKAMKETCPSAE
jgi:hypothetical protein